MNRRAFLYGLTLGTLDAPLAAGAQQPGKIYRVGILGDKAADSNEILAWQTFRDGPAGARLEGGRVATHK
jgi:hypothetical protein